MPDIPLLGSETLPPLREELKIHGLAADKRLGQHFLLDLNLTRRIARAAVPLEDAVAIEIGPGPGGLTRALFLEGARRAVVIETDARFLPLLQNLQQAVGADHFQIYQGDALQTTLASVVPSDWAGRPVKILSNLPYNISTALLTRWVTEAEGVASFTLMFQKEVADRILAKPNSKAYGRLSVLSQWRFQCRSLFDVNPNAFSPPPKVWSTVVELIPRQDCDLSLLPALESVTRAAFGQRRKMLKSSLKAVFKDVVETLADIGHRETARAEDLQVTDYVKLAQLLT